MSEKRLTVTRLDKYITLDFHDGDPAIDVTNLSPEELTARIVRARSEGFTVIFEGDHTKFMKLWRHLYSTLTTTQIQKALRGARLTDADWMEFCQHMKQLPDLHGKEVKKLSEEDQQPQYLTVQQVPNFNVRSNVKKIQEKFFPTDEQAQQNSGLLQHIRDLLLEAFKTGHAAANVLGPAEEWSNNAAFGYAIAAAKENGWDDEKIKDLIRTMRYQMDMTYSVDQAKRVYETSPY